MRHVHSLKKSHGYPFSSIAKNESSEIASDSPTVVGNTTVVTNPAKGEAVGVLESWT